MSLIFVEHLIVQRSCIEKPLRKVIIVHSEEGVNGVEENQFHVHVLDKEEKTES